MSSRTVRGRLAASALAVALAACACAPLAACAGGAAEVEEQSEDAAPLEVSDRPLEEQPALDDTTATRIEDAVAASGAAVGFAYVDLSADPHPRFAVNGDDPRTAASMIKLLVLAELLDQVASGAVSLDDALVIEPSDIVGGTGVLQGWGAGASVTIDELALHMIADSDNTAANMLIDMLGMDAINDEATQLGLASTALERRMMDESAMAQGIENRMSANDAARILEALYDGEIGTPELCAHAIGYLEQQTFAGGLAGGLSAGATFAHKTGSLSGVTNDAGIVEGDRPCVLAMFVEGVDEGSANALMAQVAGIVFEGR